jgi:hypothetical protein
VFDPSFVFGGGVVGCLFYESTDPTTTTTKQFFFSFVDLPPL